jgi:hypothetical protein
MESQFTFKNLYLQYEEVLKNGYKVVTCEQYVRKKKELKTEKILVNRVDIDFSIKKTEPIIELFNELGVKASFFIRLHAPEYNPMSFENYRIVKKLILSGHELGYHSEVIDQAAIWNESAETCLLRDLKVLESMFDTKVVGVASHGGMTGLNNLDFWKNRNPADYGLLYEAYDTQPNFNLFHSSFYISDSEWYRWKCYDQGLLVVGDNRNIAQHCSDGHKLIYALIHPDSYFRNHFYE